MGAVQSLRAVAPLITAERARELFAYDKTSGVLRWRVGRRNVIEAGARAGTVKTGSTGKQARQVNVEGRFYAEHRLIFLIVTGRWPDPEIDHEDGDALNNRWRNLREATRAQNKQNRAAAANNKAGLKGVRSLANGAFQAAISAHLGTFKTARAAHIAYCRAAKLLRGEFANTKSRAPAPANGGLSR
jgi:hypothetical protein